VRPKSKKIFWKMATSGLFANQKQVFFAFRVNIIELVYKNSGGEIHEQSILAVGQKRPSPKRSNRKRNVVGG